MSTRSGKRIHSSFHENTVKADIEIGLKSERKTRTKRLKENDDHIDVVALKSKKRENYVSYPTDDEQPAESEGKASRKPRRNTLKEHNFSAAAPETFLLNGDSTTRKVLRSTRATKKFPNNADSTVTKDLADTLSKPQVNGELKSKKNKKKSKSIDKIDNIEPEKVSKKSKKKNKKGKDTVSKFDEKKTRNDLNKSNISTDSFHSAAGSPPVVAEDKDKDTNGDDMTVTEKHKVNTTFEKLKNLTTELLNTTCKKVQSNISTPIVVNPTFEKKKNDSHDTPLLNGTLDKSKLRNTRSKDLTCGVTDQGLNTTFDKIDSQQLNTTFEKKKLTTSVHSEKESVNTTFDKKSLENTFEKTEKLNSTYDKNESKSSSTKSSLISSDNTINLTFDKSNPSISITSDESVNIVNTTPMLIESSLDESGVQSKLSSPKNNDTDTLQAQTPLKREGTFTKDGPEVTVSPQEKASEMVKTPENKTPTKTSLPAAGCTPFHTDRRSNREKSAMNVTRSFEKPRRSSVAETAPRLTKVMFCSFVENPNMMSQQKRKIIKSSMKGSNKSFVLEDNMTPAPRAGARRKRSYTVGEGEESRAKRERPAAPPARTDRPRPRTVSAAARLASQTPQSNASQTQGTSEAKPTRTKLPNFAALHRKEFSKMESLDECQSRKARRAKQLLTPNGGVTVLERRSSRGSLEPLKPENVKTKQDKDVKKPDPQKPKAEPSKAKEENKVETPKPKLPTLESLRPGYTRFGFKMAIEGNPFSIPSKTETKVKRNGRDNILASMTGTTRREQAKQVIMRERSFTSSSKRYENRTIIKGVRTNRRFELQMKLRNINN